jgi:phosphoribosyl 1,2-cyclic phosphodiesterase
VQAPLAFEDETPPLRVVVLGSGSGGNAVVVESDGRRLLVDAGFSCRELERRMRSVGVEPKSIDALLLTHEHEDHVRGAGRFALRHRVPLWATAGTLAGTEIPPDVVPRVTTLESGQIVEIAGFAIEPFQIPHDAREPVGFVVEDGRGRRLGLASDMGCRSRLAWAKLVALDLLVLETNHDLDLLRNGPYPWSLKQRVAGRHGHLSNVEASDGLPELLSDRLRTLVLYHLSRVNNTAALAAATVGEALERAGSRAAVVVSEQFQPTSWLEVVS